MKKAIIILLAMLLAISTVAGIITSKGKSDAQIVDAVVNTQTDENVCTWEATGSYVDCDTVLDASGTCAAGAICSGGHTHPASQVTAGTFTGNYMFTGGTLDADTLNTGQGDNELYDMNQNVLTTSDVKFANVNIEGTGDRYLYINSSDDNDAGVYMMRQGDGFTDYKVIAAGGDYEVYRSGDDGAIWEMLYELDQTDASFSAGIGLNADTVNTGQGDNELYDMNQNVQTTDAVTFATVDTGQGANELYDMNQNVLTTSAVQFATVNTGQGANELYDMNQNVLTTSDVTFDDLTLTGNVTMSGSTDITYYGSGGCRIVNSTGIFDEVVCSQ